MRFLFVIALLIGASSAATLTKFGTSVSASASASTSASSSSSFSNVQIAQPCAEVVKVAQPCTTVIEAPKVVAAASASASSSSSVKITPPCLEVVETPCAEVVKVAQPCAEIVKVAQPCAEIVKVAQPCTTVIAPKVQARASASARASGCIRRRIPCERRPVRRPCPPVVRTPCTTVVRRPCPTVIRRPCPQVVPTPCTPGCVRTPCVRRPQKIIQRRGCASARACSRRIAPRCFRPTADLLRGKELVTQMLTVGCMEWQCEPIDATPAPEEPCEVTILSDPAPCLPCGRILDRACDKIIV